MGTIHVKKMTKLRVWWLMRRRELAQMRGRI